MNTIAIPWTPGALLEKPFYHVYSPATGEYVMSREARHDPLSPGKYLCPGGATLATPPEVVPGGHAVVYDAATDSWNTVPDRRGQYWHKNGREVRRIDRLGEVPGADWVDVPQEDPDSIWDDESESWKTPLDILKERKRLEILYNGDAALSELQKGYLGLEISTWEEQRKGAAALMEDLAATTEEADLVRALAYGRDIPVDEFAEKVLQKARVYAQRRFAFLSLQKGLLADLAAIETEEDLAALDINFSSQDIVPAK